MLQKTVQFIGLVLSAATTFAQEVKMYTGCKMVLDSNVFVVFNNTAFKNDGTFVQSLSTVKFTGNADTTQEYLGGTSTTTFNNLTVNKSAFGLALKSAAIVTNTLSVDAGNLYTDSNLTLRSDINLTARVAPVAVGSIITGKANVERYIPSRRSWRLMTAPVTNSNTIFNSWQNKGIYEAGKGLLVTAPGPTGPAGNGLDTSYNNNVSMKTWNYKNQALVPVSDTKLPISPGVAGSADNSGYFIFIRGDRDPLNTHIPYTNITTINSIGELQTFTQTFDAAPISGRYTLIGNPYASPVDFNTITRTNLIKRFYAWDPALNIVGGYVMLDDLDGDGTYTKTVPASAQTKEIQSSQAFFVQTSIDSVAKITFDESSKSSVNNNLVFRPMTGSTITGNANGKIFTTLNLLNADNTIILADGAFAEFNNRFSAGVDLDDAVKFGNINENLGITRNSKVLSAERRPAIAADDTIYLKLTALTQRGYQFVFEPVAMVSPGLTGHLEDSYLNTSTAVDLAGTTTVNFAVTSAAASAAANRFKLVFKQSLSVLPVTISSVKAYQQNNNIAVEWTVENELNMIKYDVEKSADGIVFIKVNTVAVTGLNNAHNNYSWLDVNALQGNNYYRIKSYGLSGEIKYSQVVKVNITSAIGNFAIYPNPVKGSTIHLKFAHQPTGNYKFDLVNSAGQLVWTNQYRISITSNSQDLNTEMLLAAGAYQLIITGASKTVQTRQVIIQ